MFPLVDSVIGSSWTAAVKDLNEHYTQREATYPLIKQVVVEALKKIRNEKVDEHNKVGRLNSSGDVLSRRA